MGSETVTHRSATTVFEFGFSSAEQKTAELKTAAARNQQIAKQFDALKHLQDGWCCGGGVAPDKTRLEIMARTLENAYPEQLRTPTVVPTLDGHLILQWLPKDEPWVNLDIGTMEAEYCILDADGKAAVDRFDLGKDSSLASFIEFLRQNIPPGPDSTTDWSQSTYIVSAGRLVDIKADRSKTIPIEEVAKEYGLAY
ncbi:MAG: hypothetical protein LBC63_01545 [Holophagales bacterium]|nr:hypothetical protein [Holophagales bacterium]